MKILVIEDDFDVRASLVQTLEEERYAVDSVSNGPEGLYRALEWKYDLILLDVMLPGMDGWQVLETLRKEKRVTPVLMLTALDSLDDRVKGLNTGADDYLPKPYSERELLARVRALHRRSMGQSCTVIEIGDVEIDTAKQTVLLKGEQTELTASQYRIVEYLGSRAGTLVSKNELTEVIVGDDETSVSNVIDVQIYHIRRKLGKGFIQNRRGLGYLVSQL